MKFLNKKAKIGNTYYPVYQLEKTHNANGYESNDWIFFSEEAVPENEDDEFIPYTSEIRRNSFSISFIQSNSAKYKWDEWSLRTNTDCVISFNDKPIYQFGTIGGFQGMSFAMAKAEYLLTVLSEHAYNFFEPEEELGRKIYYYGLPATVIPSTTYPGEIKIKADYSYIDKDEWFKLYKERSKVFTPNGLKSPYSDIFGDDDCESYYEFYESDILNWGDALSDGNIYWFRN